MATRSTTRDALLRENAQLTESLELFAERLAELELSLEDIGWNRLTAEGEREFSNAGLARIVALCRLHYLKNPLIHRAATVQASYVWGQGVSISSSDPATNEIVQQFLAARATRHAFSGQQAHHLLEVGLQTDGNLFFVLPTNASTGAVQVRTIPVLDVIAGDIITNPEDRSEPWFYRRVWTEHRMDLVTGRPEMATRTAYYPDWRYRPPIRPDSIGNVPVLWDEPVYHIRGEGGLPDMRFGVPDLYSAIDWARAVKEDLEDFATLRRALARYAWSLTVTGGGKGVAAAKKRLGTTISTDTAETNPPGSPGGTFISATGNKLEPLRTGAAGPNPEDFRRGWLMVAAGTGIPETILAGDANVGNLATAKTLDRPTELRMRERQGLWASAMRDILGYVVAQARSRPNGPLASPELVEPVEREIQINIDFPDLLERSATDRVEAVVRAATLGSQRDEGTLGDELLVRLLLQALGVDDVDKEIVQILALRSELHAERQAQADAMASQTAGGDGEIAEALREVRAALATAPPAT